jgi:hypothetical protein
MRDGGHYLIDSGQISVVSQLYHPFMDFTETFERFLLVLGQFVREISAHVIRSQLVERQDVPPGIGLAQKVEAEPYIFWSSLPVDIAMRQA